MNRDILFAKEVQEQCMEHDYVSIINDGSVILEELVEKVASHLGLGD